MPAKQTVLFSSTPPKATVTLGGKVLGLTPFTLAFPEAEFPLQVRFEHPRYIPQEREILLGTTQADETFTREKQRLRSDSRSKRPQGKAKKRPSKKNAPSSKGTSGGDDLNVPSAW